MAAFAPTAESACWPDAVAPRRVVLDDVSRLNACEHAAVAQPRTVADVQAALARARAAGVPVCVRGTKHSMGGHSLASGGLALDMCFANAVRFDAAADTVTAGAGATWADVIRVLNAHGRAPRTLQSYASFSVGGTLAVNGHGITSDFCVAESVVRFTLVRADGTVVVVSRDNEHRELFGLALGGYGLFGVIFDATLRVDANTRLALDVLSCAVADLPHIYDEVLARGGDIEMKLARLDATTLDSVELFLFRRASDAPTVSALPAHPREMSPIGRLLYKWVAGPLREVRYALEHNLGVALDWTAVSDRNEMLFESAATLVRLYSPLVTVDDTFVLQEYFVPRACFADFVEGARAPLVNGVGKETLITLLNITIRFVQRDTDTALPYSRAEGGSFAFVLYYRLRRSAEADAVLRKYHSVLVALALRLSGTFYLPYRFHYTDAEALEAYPGLTHFCAKKHKYDPTGLFSNLWFERYGRVHTEEAAAAAAESVAVPPAAAVLLALPAPAVPPLPPRLLPALLLPVRERRVGSFRALFSHARLREEFLGGFLEDVFRIVPRAEMHRLLASAVWDSRNRTDDDIYAALSAQLVRRASPLARVSGLFSAVKQLNAQKAELVRETVSVLARLGKVGAIHAYCSIGDHGKIVLPLREALGMRGRTFIVNDVDAKEDDVPACLERGATDGREVGEFVPIDFSDVSRPPGALAGIPDASVDLVTMNQGLHHLVPSQVPAFLAAVRRVLRPGGVFILREHDLDSPACALLPMLDCAHMVFNAATGVSLITERQELRCFRPLEAWREIVAAAGFDDPMVYEMQTGDPTVDIMAAFVRPGGAADACNTADTLATIAAAPQQAPRGAGAAFQLVMNQLPGLAIEGATGLLETVLAALPALRDRLRAALAEPAAGANAGANAGAGALASATSSVPPAVRMALRQLLDVYVEPALVMLARFRPLAAVAQPVTDSRRDLLFPSELFLLEPALRRRAAEGAGVEAAIVALLDRLAAVMAESQAALGGSSGAANEGVPPVAGAPSEDDVAALLERVCAAVPLLRDAGGTLAAMGLPPKAEAMARAALAAGTTGSDVRAAARALAQRLDERGWAELQAAALRIMAERRAPHLSLLLQRGGAWCDAATAVLGCPRVGSLTQLQAALAAGVGLGGLVALAEEAREARGRNGSVATSAAAEVVPQAAAVARALLPLCPIVTYTGPLKDIAGVFHVESARMEARSLTGLLATSVVDMTDAARTCLDCRSATLRLSELEKPSALRLGERVYVVEYRAAAGAGATATAAVGTLARALAAAGLIDGSARAGNAPSNMYKLPEWLQVEVMQHFADSMTHTPWFRFPFLATLRVYFAVLAQEVAAVGARNGWAAALASEGFVTNLIPGVAMSAVFAQLMLLAWPLRLALGDENPTALYVEQLVLLAPSGTDFRAIDSRVRSAREAANTPGLFVLEVPTFLPLTAVLMRIASDAPTAVLISLSNHTVVQVKVTIASTAGTGAGAQQFLQRLSSLPGVAPVLSFRLPAVGGALPPREEAAFAVDTPSLLLLIRAAAELPGGAVHVYDFN
jgi:FAD/FMN-containing dehydrogenase/SAM-dependent methyltransferase